MKKNRNTKAICLALVALVLVIALNTGDAWAYFTNNATANGQKELNLDFVTTDIIEEIQVNPSDNSARKVVWLKNSGNYDCYVRVKAFAVNAVTYKTNEIDLNSVTMPDGTIIEGNWNKGIWDAKDNKWIAADASWVEEDINCWYYYDEIIPAKTADPRNITEPIEISFTLPAEEEIDNYNVIVVQECTPVLYDRDGTPYADWDAKEGDSTIVDRPKTN